MSKVFRVHVCRVNHLRSRIYFMAEAKMHKNSIIGKRCVYNWTYMMVDMGLDNIVHNDRQPCHARIFNVWIKDWYLDILRTRYQENYQCLLQKYNNIRFFDDEDNQTYMIASENLEFKGHTRSNKQYCHYLYPCQHHRSMNELFSPPDQGLVQLF